MFKKAVQRWLGITDLRLLEEDTNYRAIQLEDNMRYLYKLKDRVDVALVGIDRIIAKAEPYFNRDMLSAEALAKSDRIAEQVINRLEGELIASRHSTGET